MCPGVGHDQLVQFAEQSFGGLPEGIGSNEEQCEYVGGGSATSGSVPLLCWCGLV